jgi:hypothetical protein
MLVVRNLLNKSKMADEEASETTSLLASHTEHHMLHPRFVSDIILVPLTLNFAMLMKGTK